jgi:hypothetical protein
MEPHERRQPRSTLAKLSAAPRSLTCAVSAFAVIGLAAAARLLWWYWPGSFFDGTTSGVWAGLAWDFAHGDFYRPLVGPLGYGGTRYMPLLFVAHGTLIAAHVDPIHAGVVLMQASVAGAALALFLALRSADVPARLAAPLAGTVWCTVIYQESCTDLSPDYLAAALALTAATLASAAARRTGPSRAGWLIAAALTIVLAALTKVTALAFAAPITLWLALEQQRRAALWFSAVAAALFATAIGIVQAAADGRFLAVFFASLSGGMLASHTWYAIPTFAKEVALDPFVAVPFAIACWCLRASLRRRLALEHWYFLTAIVVTLVIFTSPGTVWNHLVDLQLASTLLVGAAIARSAVPPKAVAWVYGALAFVLAAVSWPLPGIPSVVATLQAHGPRPRAVVAAIHAEFLPPGTRYLSTDPIVPVLSDESAVLLDAFDLRRFLRDGGPPGRDVERQVRGHAFSVIVMRDAGLFPRDMNAGDAGFAEACRRYWTTEDDDLERLFRSAYEIRAVRRPFVILLPAGP